MDFRNIKFTSDTKIAYGVGKVRALENKMIPQQTFEQISEAPLENVYKSITEFGYSEKFEESIELNKKENYKIITNLIRKIERYKELSDIYLLKEDCLNLKNYLKSKLLSEEDTVYSVKFNISGKLSEEEIKNVIEKHQYQIMDSEDADIIEEYISKAKETKFPSEIEHLIDKLYFALIFRKIERSKVDYLKFYFQEYIDLLNIENLIRFKILKKDFDIYLRFYFNNGSLKIKELQELYNIKLEDMPARFKTRGFYNTLVVGVESWLKNGNLNMFEIEKDNYLINLAKITKVLSFGVEPLFGYLFGKEIEYKNLRIIINGKKIKLSSNNIKEMLRETYV